jgi:hypothetical protein
MLVCSVQIPEKLDHREEDQRLRGRDEERAEMANLPNEEHEPRKPEEQNRDKAKLNMVEEMIARLIAP